jgi:hypothetical protein
MSNKLSRVANRAFAAVTGYFWLPCPLCKQHFGGHQWRDINGLSSMTETSDGVKTGICPDCTRAGKGGAQ